MPITTNQKGGYLTFRGTTTGFLRLNTDGLTNGANVVGETVDSMSISKLMWSFPAGGGVTVNRGANTVAILNGSGVHDYQEEQVKLEVSRGDEVANVVFTVSGSGYFIAKLQKRSGGAT